MLRSTSVSAKATTLETGLLFGVAVEAALSIKAHPRKGGQRAALVSVVFSVVALEAFVNEITEYALATSECLQSSEPQEVAVFAQVMADAAASRATLEARLSLANGMLSGRPLNPEAYQDFALLIRLRNDLVHFKPNGSFTAGAAAGAGHKELKELIANFKGKNILAEDAFTAWSWTYLVQTKAVAEWSCKTAARTVSEFCKADTGSGFRSVLDGLLEAFETHIAILDANRMTASATL